MSKFIFNFIIVISILYFIYYYIIEYKNEEDNTNLSESLLEYKILKNNINANKIQNKFNIKEFDSINDNIIIHNKYKNELLEYKNQKEKLVNEINKLNEENNKKIYEQLQQNIKKEKEYNLISNINKLKVDIKSLISLLKYDLNNILNDIKKNKLSNIDKENLKLVLFTEIKKTTELYNNLTELTEQNNLTELTEQNKLTELNNLYKQLLEKKIKILNKKYKIYCKILK